jgi:hypothetical protein
MDDAKETLRLLRIGRAEAIAAFQFQKAKDLEQKMKTVKDQLAADTRSNRRSVMADEFEIEKERIRKRATENHGQFSRRLLALRKDYEDRLGELKQAHAIEMERLATNFSKDIELSSIRGVPESRELLRMSKLTGEFSRYELADELYDEGIAVHSETIDARQAEVHATYESREAEILAKHADALALHNDKLQNEIALIVREYEKELTVLRQAYIVHTVKYRVPDSERNAAELFAPYLHLDDTKFPGQGRESPKRSPRGSRTQARSRGSPLSPRYGRTGRI